MLRPPLHERKAFFDQIFDQKTRRLEFKYANRASVPVTSPEFSCKRSLKFDDQNLGDIEKPPKSKRKLNFSNIRIEKENPPPKKQKVEGHPTLDTSAPMEIPVNAPVVIRKARVGMQLELSPLPMSMPSPSREMSSQPIRRGKEPKFFTFSEEHVALSSESKLNCKLAYKQKLRKAIEETAQLIEQFSPGYIQRIRANPFPKVSPEELDRMIEEYRTRTEEGRVHVKMSP